MMAYGGANMNADYWDSVKTSLIEAGFEREFIEGLNVNQLADLYLAWDVEDPDEQWERVDAYFFVHDELDYDYEEIFA